MTLYGSPNWYQRAIDAATERFAPLAAALTRELGLDVEPAVDQTGGMVMCLGIHWPDDRAYVWFSDYWWFELILGLYDSDVDEGTYPEPPPELLAMLKAEGGGGEDTEPTEQGKVRLADAIAKWAAPFIAEHGRKHGWERRF